jgi:hypothetical protein
MQNSYVYDFSNGLLKYSCGLYNHKSSILRTIQLEDEVTILKKSKYIHNKYMYQTTVTCFDVVNNDEIFFGPLTQKESYVSNYNNLTGEYLRKYKTFNKKYINIDTVPSKKEHLMNEYLSAYSADDEFSNTKSLMSLGENIRILNEYLKQHYIDMKKLSSLNILCEEARDRYKSLFICVLPLCLEDNTLIECSICLIDCTSKDDAGYLPCGHSFHNHCIHSWIKQNKNSCPNCRRILPKNILSLNNCLQSFKHLYSH